MTTHGNYQGYSGASRHVGTNPASHVIDSRLLYLPPSIFTNASVLDIGCNNGAIAGHLLTFFSPQKVVGVDIDQTLITKARSHISFILSRRRPTTDTTTTTTPHYFPISSILHHGHLPPRTPTPATSFYAQDWPATPLAASESASYDVVLALSVVKWVHLHRGDAGLRTFFEKVAAALKPGGYFILEPQPWESYSRAVKKNPQMKAQLAQLSVRPQDGFAEVVVRELGLALVKRWGGEVGLKREIFLYRKA